MPFDPTNVTLGDMVHGGAIATLADMTVMATAWAGAEVPDSLRGVTTSLSMQFLAPARATDLIGVGRVLRRGKTLVNCDVDIVTPDGEAGREGDRHLQSRLRRQLMVKQLAAGRNIASASWVGEEQRGVPWPPSFIVARSSAPPHRRHLHSSQWFRQQWLTRSNAGRGPSSTRRPTPASQQRCHPRRLRRHRRRPRGTATRRPTSRSVSARPSRSYRYAPASSRISRWA